jgi:hypothetical protein
VLPAIVDHLDAVSIGVDGYLLHRDAVKKTQRLVGANDQEAFLEEINTMQARCPGAVR